MRKEIKKEKIRKVFLDELPKWETGTNKGRVIWNLSIGYNIKFIYDDIEGEIEIMEFDKTTNKLTILYRNNEYSLETNSIIKCKLGIVLNKRNKNYIYNIGDKIIIRGNELEIKNRYKENYNKYYNYECLNCGNTDKLREYDILHDIGCNVCCRAPRKVLKGYNDIATTHPDLIKYFVNIEDAYSHTFGSKKGVLLRCLDCGNKKYMKISYLTQNGKIICPKCGDGFYYPNKLMFNILNQFKIEFETEKKFEWCKFKLNEKDKYGIYDFYVPSLNLIIEMDGAFHFIDKNISKQKIKESQYLDNEKDRLARENGITIIRINCYYKSIENRFEHIKNNIINGELNKFFNMDTINFKSCNEFAISNLVKTVCELKRDNPEMTTKDISDKIEIHRDTVIKYLKQGTKIWDWCTYDPKEESKKSWLKNKQNSEIKIINLDTLEIFESILKAKEKYKKASIYRACSGEFDYSDGYRWMYYKEYLQKGDIKQHLKKKIRKVINLNTNEVFENMTLANKKYNTSKIIEVCNKTRKTAKGYKWMFYDEYLKLTEQEKLDLAI